MGKERPRGTGSQKTEVTDEHLPDEMSTPQREEDSREASSR